MESIIEVIDGILQIETSDEEEVYTLKKEKNMTPDVSRKGNNIMWNSEIEDSGGEEENSKTNKVPSTIIHKYHPLENIIGNLNEGVMSISRYVIANIYFISKIEPKNVKEDLNYKYWINSMQEELVQ